MKKRKKYVLATAILWIAFLMYGNKAEASQRLFDIVVRDGYTTQVIEMKYGKTPYGYISYYANQSVIYVNAKAKNVTFSVKKNTSSRYGNFQFASSRIKPGERPVGNLFTYTTDGKTRAWMFTVQKYVEPEVKYLKITSPKKGTAFRPKKKKDAKIKTFIKTEVPVKTIVRIFDANGKLIYKKNYGETGSKTYQVKWDGKPSKGNQAKLNSKKYVPAGEYTVRVTVYPKIGKKASEIVKETKLVVE